MWAKCLGRPHKHPTTVFKASNVPCFCAMVDQWAACRCLKQRKLLPLTVAVMKLREAKLVTDDCRLDFIVLESLREDRLNTLCGHAYF